LFRDPFPEQPFRHGDILCLASFVATAQQDHHRIAVPVKVDAITGTLVNAKFADPAPCRRRVASMSVSKAVQTGHDQCACPLILQPRPLLPTLLYLLPFEHWPMLVY
jgi:hypothetical protein